MQPTRQEALSYLASLSKELADMAKDAELAALAHIFSMATVEAQTLLVTVPRVQKRRAA